MKIRFAVLFIVLCVAGVFLYFEDELTPVYRNLATFMPADDASFSGSGRRIEITFDYERQGGAGSNQYAVWIEDADGKLIRTLAVTKYTSTGGWRLRKTSLSHWRKIADPLHMSMEEIEAVSGATPQNSGSYRVIWDFTDDNGNQVPDGEYKCRLEAALFFSSYALYDGTFTTGNEAAVIYPTPQYSCENSSHIDMIGQVEMAYYPE
ncbi:DUF2271 domain-containing protein [Clostridium sp. MCC353]|uniref:DUF2271 domain-containing protein n=1 Tax=Clostridium sp. MCC353 TaxID=2592646 RepID=UPI001C02D744|nr:DUF2271 domain-containing protein [Clostridium sp. MCC353]MBT9779850.1 DUF2271 domain-containing protein [Clostridium sp. MCC353]